MLAAVEIALRLRGDRPGWLSLHRPVTSGGGLESQPGRFFTDDEGVYRALPSTHSQGAITNSDGFRGVEFRPDAPGPKILFLGDSFTWGLRADPLVESFVDRVGRAGNTVFNTGIPGTGPTQYAFLAEKWVPRLKPDWVVVMFYMGNDIGEGDAMVPGKPLFHPTRFGAIRAFDGKTWLGTPDEALRHWVDSGNVFEKSPNGHFKAWFGKTVIGTRLWVLTHRPKLRRPRAAVTKEAVRFTRSCLERIRAVSKENGGRFRLFIIPSLSGRMRGLAGFESHRDVFFGFEPRVPKFVTPSDYGADSIHFNNEGHRKYAGFILQALGEPETPSAATPR